MYAHHFLNYLSGGSQLVNLNGVETLYYGYTDNQGSLIALTDASGNVVEKYAYDPWGARRNPNDWTQLPSPQGEGSGVRYLTNRGYTGHEHLDMFNIINMNGRVYDPLTAQFFSPDPFIQSGSDWKNYNRYSYCMNNPTRYTDPTGYQYYYMESFIDNTRGSGWGDVLGGGGGGGSFLETSLAWNAKGSISYDWGSQGFEYANGDEATTKDAMDQLYRGTPKKDIQYYSSSSLGYDHLYVLDVGGSLRLAGSVGGEITGVTNGNFDVTNNGIGAVLAANSEAVAFGNGNSLSNINTGLGVFGTLNDIGINIANDYVSYGFKSANGWQEFGKLASNQQAWRAASVLGENGANVLKYAKGLGVATAALSSAYSLGNAGVYYYNGGTDMSVGIKSILDVTMTGVGFLGPIGFGISVTYFVLDTATNGFGEYGKIK